MSRLVGIVVAGVAASPKSPTISPKKLRMVSRVIRTSAGRARFRFRKLYAVSKISA
jgi:hypothetical protein